MAAGKIEPVICDTPFELWQNLHFVMGHSINSLYEINMPELKILSIDVANITSLPYSSLKKLETITMYGAHLGDLELYKLPSIQTANLAGNDITSLDAHDCTSLGLLNISNNTNLSGINIQGCSSLSYFNAENGSLSENDINHIAYYLAQYGINGGYLNLRYGSNAIPPMPASMNIGTLVGRGWTTYTN